MPDLINTARNSVSSFKTELESLRQSALGIDSSVCDLDATISSLRSSTDTQEAKITALENISGEAEEFISEVISIDEAAAEAITTSKDDFYDTYDYLKPDSEKSGWENFWEDVGDGLAAVGDWCKEHWEEIKIVLFVLECVAAIVLMCIPGTQALGMAIAVGIIKGFVTGALIGGLSAWAQGGTWADIFQGAFSGAVSGGIMGGIFGAVGFAGAAFGAAHNICKFASLVQNIAKVSGVVSIGMMGFDIAALGAQCLTKLGFGNPLFDMIIDFNQTCHQSKLYNFAQISIGLVAAFTGSLYKSADEHGNTCFIAGTLVATANGLVAIENIKAGDKVMATDPETMEIAEKTVVETYVRTDSKLYHIIINGEEFVTTETHPFYVQGKGFIEAGKLNVGDKLLDISGKTLVIDDITIEVTEEPTTVYNFQVEDFHTYHVGENGVFVHNTCTKEQLAENAKNGKAAQDARHQELLEEHPETVQEVTIKPIGDDGVPVDYNVRVDELTNDFFNEVKASETAPYTKNQLPGYELLQRNGGIVRSANKPGFPQGTVLGPLQGYTTRAGVTVPTSVDMASHGG